MNAQTRPRTGRAVRDLVLTLGLTLLTPLLHIADQAPMHDECHAEVIVERAEVSPVEAGITLTGMSRVSIHRTPQALLVQVLTGEVLLKPQGAVARPMVVTAGNVQISDIDAVVCVGVKDEQSVIAVVAGVTRVATLSAGADSQVLSEMTLRAGDRVAVSREGTDVMFRLQNDSGGQPTQPCSGSAVKAARDE